MMSIKLDYAIQLKIYGSQEMHVYIYINHLRISDTYN